MVLPVTLTMGVILLVGIFTRYRRAEKSEN